MNSTAVNAGTVTGVQTAVPGGTYRTSSDQSSGNVFSMLMEKSREADTSDRKTVSVDSTKKTADSSSQRSSASEIRDVSAAEPKSEEPSGTDRTEEKAEPKQKDEALEALSAALEAQIAVQNAAGSTKADPVKAGSKPAADVTAVTEPVSGEEAFSGQASMEDRTISTVPADSEQAGPETAAGDRKEETIPEEKDTPVQKETLKETSGAKSEKTEVYSDEKQEKVDSSEKRSDFGGSVKKSESRRRSSERHQGPGDSYKEEARDSETGPGVNMASAAGPGRTEALGPGIGLQSAKQTSPAGSETLVQTLKTSEDALPRSVSSLLLKSVSDGKRELELKLEPKNLGKLSLKLSISESGIRVSITATEKRTEALLSAHADEMASILTKNTGEETKIFVPRQDAGAKPGQNSGQESESEGEMYQEDRQREQQESRRNHQSESFLQRMRLGLQ